jgi:hypothetical protein
MLLLLWWVVCGGEYKQLLILNVTEFVVRFWVVEIIEELILNINVFVVSFWVVEYREEQILIITVFVVRVWERGI